MLNPIPQTSVSTRPQNLNNLENARDSAVTSTRIIWAHNPCPLLTRAAHKAQQQIQQPLLYNNEAQYYHNNFNIPQQNSVLTSRYCPEPSVEKKSSTKVSQNNNKSQQSNSQNKKNKDTSIYSVEESNFAKTKETSIRIVKSDRKSQKMQAKEFQKTLNWFNNFHADNMAPNALKAHFSEVSSNQAAEEMDKFVIRGSEYPISQLQFKEIKKDKVTSLYLKKRGAGKKNKKQQLEIVYKLVKHDQPNVNQKNLQKQCEWLRNEHEIISRLNHPNIMTSLGYFQNIMVNGQRQCGMLMEEANQDLKKLIWDIEQHKRAKHNLFLSDIKRVFIEIIEPVRYLHTLGLAHNDLKMDNFFAFKINQTNGYKKINNYKFKLADFEMARHKSQIKSYKDLQQFWKLVNISYSGPEAYELIYENSQEKFDEQKNDIFQLGLILFKMLFKNYKPQVNYGSNQKMPFLHFQNDPIYRNLIKKNNKAFWDCHIHEGYWNGYEDVDGKATKQKIIQRSKRLKQTIQRQFEFYHEVEPELHGQNVVENVKDLLQKMLAYNPRDRPTIEEISRHPWVQN